MAQRTVHTQKAKGLTAGQQDHLLSILRERFEQHMQRHSAVKWDAVLANLKKDAASLWSLHRMEETGGEPDIVNLGRKKGEIVFVDCSEESPKERRSLCYDREALDSRKEHKPKNSATDLAAEIGIELLTEEEYRTLQSFGEFDTKTSSWIRTPNAIRELGGALFCDRRFDHVFTYHNGAESYYASRGFRGALRL